MSATTSSPEAVETDRELLELAAKAAGYGIDFDDAMVLGQGTRYFMTDGPVAGDFWNPLTDDGDALRLAVKLRLHVDHSRTGDVCVWVFARDGAAHDFEEQSDDQYADTRRAITRAAAAIGAALPA